MRVRKLLMVCQPLKAAQSVEINPVLSCITVCLGVGCVVDASLELNFKSDVTKQQPVFTAPQIVSRIDTLVKEDCGTIIILHPTNPGFAQSHFT